MKHTTEIRFLRTALVFPRKPRRVISSTAFAIGLLVLASSAHAQPYYPPLSGDDLQVIGRGLDKLFGVDPADRAFTDRTRVYDRIQSYITQRNQELAKAQADAAKAAADKSVADAVEKAKADAKSALDKAVSDAIEKAKSEEPQP